MSADGASGPVPSSPLLTIVIEPVPPLFEIVFYVSGQRVPTGVTGPDPVAAVEALVHRMAWATTARGF